MHKKYIKVVIIIFLIIEFIFQYVYCTKLNMIISNPSQEVEVEKIINNPFLTQNFYGMAEFYLTGSRPLTEACLNGSEKIVYKLINKGTIPFTIDYYCTVDSPHNPYKKLQYLVSSGWKPLVYFWGKSTEYDPLSELATISKEDLMYYEEDGVSGNKNVVRMFDLIYKNSINFDRAESLKYYLDCAIDSQNEILVKYIKKNLKAIKRK